MPALQLMLAPQHMPAPQLMPAPQHMPAFLHLLFDYKPAVHAARPAARMPTAQKRAVFKKRKNLKSRATGAVGMCASRRDVHISIAEGVSGNGRGGEREAFSTPVGDRAVRCGQRDSVTLSMPSGVQACMAGGAAA